MFLTEISIRRPVFTAMVTVALMTLGLLGARSLGVDLYPKVDFPVTVIVTPYPGAGPEEVEQLVTKPIEDAVYGLDKISSVRASSSEGVSIVTVELEQDANVDFSLQDAQRKVMVGDLVEDARQLDDGIPHREGNRHSQQHGY